MIKSKHERRDKMFAAHESPLPALNDLNPIKYGYQDCPPNHKSGNLRKFSLIHYVVKGKGRLFKYGKEYDITAGNAFFIPANENAYYQADVDDPWSYVWIGFDGALASDFKILPAVFEYSGTVFEQVHGIALLDKTNKIKITANLFMLYEELVQNNSQKETYIDWIKGMINAGDRMTDLSVDFLAKCVHISPQYLVRQFKKETGMTVQDYILDVRVKKAKTMLESGFSVAQIAENFGYSDYSVFSRMFKKKTGKSPNEWTKENTDGI